MTMISVLLTAGLCVLTHCALAGEFRMEDAVAHEEKVLIAPLSNGVRTYIRENESPSQCCSLRVVIRKSSGAEERFSFDGSLDSPERMEEFLAVCKKKILGEVPLDQACDSFCSDPALFHMDHPDEIAVVAVGDFTAQSMRDKVEKHFGDIVFEEASSSSLQIGQDEKISKVILRLSYPNLPLSIATYGDLKESWKFLLVQELFQQRMERCSRGMDEMWVHPHSRFFYPVSGYAFVSEESMENLLSFFLWQAAAARSDGFFEDEFYVIKNKLLDQLQYLSFNATNPDHAFLASYYADQFLLGNQCFNCQDFLSASAELVEQIQSEDIFSCVDSFFQNENRQISVMHPKPRHRHLLTQDRVDELVDKVTSLASFYRDSEVPEEESLWGIDSDDIEFLVARNEKKPFDFATNAGSAPFVFASSEGSVESFFGLPLSEKEKRFIKSIISTMADKNLIQLVFEKSVLEKKGKKIHHVHPLRFMGYILSSPELKSDVRTIKKSSFKWDAFVDGFAKRMKEELSHGNVYQHIPGFAMEIGTTAKHVEEYVHKKDFEGLIRSLL